MENFQLQEHFTIICQQTSTTAPKKNDVVLIHHEILPHIKWTNVIIVELIIQEPLKS